MKQISIENFSELVQENNDINIIDVRSAKGFNKNHIAGAVNIPLNSLSENLNQLDKNKHYYIICQIGISSTQGAQFLNQHGYEITNVESGMSAYLGETITSNE